VKQPVSCRGVGLREISGTSGVPGGTTRHVAPNFRSLFSVIAKTGEFSKN
jgi:hypothetical protein